MKRASNIFHAAFVTLLLIPATAGAQALGLHTVVIDAGHGGKDSGAVSLDRYTYEKVLNLDLSNRLRLRIEQAYPKSVKVLMSRTKDEVFVPLIDRSRFASRNNADLFISFHINAQAKGSNVQGYSIHILGQSTKTTKSTYDVNAEVCRRENEVIFLEDDYTTNYQGLDPDDPESEIFLNLMAKAYRQQSIRMAELVDEKLKASGVYGRSLGIWQNNFAVLRNASMPAVLLELGFITNSEDIARLRDESNRDRIADALFEAFVAYKEEYDHSVGVEPEKPLKIEKTPVWHSPYPIYMGPVAIEPTPAATTTPQPTETTQPATTTEPAKEQPDTEVLYGTQIIATSYDFSKTDKMFLGYEPKIVEVGVIKKYIIGVNSDKNRAKELNREITTKYPDSFMVCIRNGKTELLKN